jgi:hypothetical protein
LVFWSLIQKGCEFMEVVAAIWYFICILAGIIDKDGRDKPVVSGKLRLWGEEY